MGKIRRRPAMTRNPEHFAATGWKIVQALRPRQENPMTEPTTNRTHYTKARHDNPNGGTQLWYIVCDEGWRDSIVCERMYEWTADWLLEVLGDRPYAPGHRP